MSRFHHTYVAIRDLLLLACDSAFRATHSASRSDDDDVVIVRMDGIGDFVVWLDAFKALRTHYADRRITLVCNSAWYDLATQVPGFDEIIPIEVRRLRFDLSYRYRTFASLAHRRFAILINPIYSRQGFSDAEAVARMIRADEKITFKGDPAVGWRSRLDSYWYDRLLPATDQPLMELIRNAEFLRGLGLTDFRAGQPELPIDTQPDPDLTLHEYYVLFPGGSDPIRIWPAASFAEVGRRIHERTGMVGVVCGGPGDKEAAAEIVSLSRVPMLDRSGRTSLPNLASLIGRSRLIVSNETGAVHMAAALGIPGVCILGGGHFGRFMPYVYERRPEGLLSLPVFHKMDCYGCNWQCPYPHGPGNPAPCVAGISVDAVLEKIDAILKVAPGTALISPRIS